MRTITLEEHFASQLYIDSCGEDIKSMPGIAEKLVDLGEKRIAEMDKAGIDVQVLSLNSPGVEMCSPAEAITLAKETNDLLALATKNHPERFAGFAAIPTPDPKAAVSELERTVQSLGFKGAVINGHVNGRYLDDEFFRPIMACAERLNVPIYLHPAAPPHAVSDIYYSGFSPMIDDLLKRPGYGWHIETGIHIIRLILGGVFDKFPSLQFIIGHLGESLPYMMQRMNDVFTPERTNLSRSMSAYLKENVYYTISGFNYLAPFMAMLEEVGVERIMFSADYPYAQMQKARTFLDDLPLSDAGKHLIAHGNAEALFGF